jgi:hypothetical protein
MADGNGLGKSQPKRRSNRLENFQNPKRPLFVPLRASFLREDLLREPSRFPSGFAAGRRTAGDLQSDTQPNPTYL